MSEGGIIVGIEAIVGGKESSGGLADGLHLSLRHAADAREADGGVVTGARRAGGAVRVVDGVGGGKISRDIWLWIHLFLFFSFFLPLVILQEKVGVGEAAETSWCGRKTSGPAKPSKPDC